MPRPQNVTTNSDSAFLEFALPVGGFWSFVETDGARIRVAGAAVQGAHARPQCGTQTHRARLGAGVELEVAARGEVVCAERLSGQRDSDDLGVQDGSLVAHDEVDPDGHKPARRQSKIAAPNGPPVP